MYRRVTTYINDLTDEDPDPLRPMARGFSCMLMPLHELMPAFQCNQTCAGEKNEAASVQERSRLMIQTFPERLSLIVAARSVDLQVAGADGRRVSRAVPDLQHSVIVLVEDLQE